MPTPLPQSKLPTAPLPEGQIAYVTDNERDAEALQVTMDCPVVCRPPADPSRSPALQSRLILETFQTAEAFVPFDHPEYPDAPDA